MKTVYQFIITAFCAFLSGGIFVALVSAAFFMTEKEFIDVSERVWATGFKYPISAILVCGGLIFFISSLFVSLPARNTRRVYND